jgi:hypothetical protein
VIPDEGKLDSVVCLYTPVAGSSDVPRLAGQMTIYEADLAQSLRDRLVRFLEAMREFVGIRQYEIDGSTVDVVAEITQVRLYPDNEELHIFFGPSSEPGRFTDLTEAQKRLASSILSSLTALSWKDLHRRIGLPTASNGEKPQVFISYRHGHERFAEALAKRLGQEGLLPWFDRWDVRAGDSLPGRIDEAFTKSIAFIPIITADYEQGAWATEEMRTAIAKRVAEGYRIVPILLEHCDQPELTKQLVYVDMTDQDPQAFESKIADIVDGIFGLEANPFR